MHNICTFLGLWTQIIFLNVHSWTAGRNKELACIYHIKPDPTNPPVLLCSRFTWNWNAVLPTWEKTWGKALHVGRDDMYDYVVLDRRHMLYNNAESLAVEKNHSMLSSRYLNFHIEFWFACIKWESFLLFFLQTSS